MANHKNIIPHIKKWEGGLSKAKSDTASVNPAPGTGGVHTNQGITWGTFKALAPQVGVAATSVNFLGISADTWEKIFKRGYWDELKCDEIKSQAVADFVADLAWGSGPGVAIKALQKGLTDIGIATAVDGKIGPQTVANVNKADESKLLDAMFQNRVKQLFAYKQPANIEGWINRVMSLYFFAKRAIIN